MKELHLTAKDFKLEWYSGTGPGGQNRNKLKACCRITHLETGLRAHGTQARDRVTNQRNAFNTLAARLIAHYSEEDAPQRRNTSKVIRNYHGVRNEVHDKASGYRQTYREVVVNGNLGEMIKARREQSLMESTD